MVGERRVGVAPASGCEGTVSQDTTKAMQEALQAAVSRMNTGGAEAKPGPLEIIGMVAPIVQKLLEGSESSEEIDEKLEALHTGDLATLREHLQILRKKSVRMMKFQEQLLGKMDEIRKEQNTVSRAVIDLAHQMARITFIDEGSAGEEDYDEELIAAERYSRADFRANGDGYRRMRNT